jgi:hypothetical protein
MRGPAGDDDEDDLPGMFATPAEELEFWRTRTIDGRRRKHSSRSRSSDASQTCG